MMAIRAFAIIPNDVGEGALLVFAPNRNRARYLALTNGTWEYGGYADINARRAPAHDGAFDVEWVVDTNDDIPPGYPAFYTDGEDDDDDYE